MTVLAGCSVPQDRADTVAATAERFSARAAARDMSAACALLAPTVREELAGTPGPTCAAGLTEAGLPFAGSVRSTAVYGRHAQVTLDGDTYFLALSTEGWRVVAAGCTPRTDRPYDCEVKGD
ncbi:hypothetical protein ACWGIN_22965 [Streptomyces sp. NPDC054861]